MTITAPKAADHDVNFMIGANGGGANGGGANEAREK
jgi:hypothetical protein